MNARAEANRNIKSAAENNMIDMLLTWILSSTAIFLTSKIVDDFKVTNYKSAFVVSFVVGLLNMTIKPILFILTLPVTILTLGLFSFVLNAIILKIAAKILHSFSIKGWMPAILGAIVLAIVNMLLFGLFN